MKKLTEQQLSEISLGYNWNPEMSYEQFIVFNPELSYEKSWDLYVQVDRRYCEKLSELL